MEYVWVNPKTGQGAYIIPEKNGKVSIGTMEGRYPKLFKDEKTAIEILRKDGYKET